MTDYAYVEQDTTYGTVENIPSVDHSYHSIFWMSRRRITSAELNHLQAIQNDSRAKLAAAISQQGFSYRSAYTADGTLNTMTVDRTYALAVDNIVDLAGGASGSPTSITYGIPPAPAVGTETSLVFLEVYVSPVGPIGSSQSIRDIPTFGLVSPANGPMTNDILRANVGQPTTLRMQSRSRIRVARGVAFSAGSNPSGFLDHSTVFAQGGAVNPNATYTYADMGATRREYAGLWVAGHGDQQSATDLVSDTGFVYALAMFQVTRTAGVVPPDIKDLRQLTNGNFVGIFDLIAPCILIVKGFPVKWRDCSNLIDEMWLSSAPVDPVATPMGGTLSAQRFQSTATVASGNQPWVTNSNVLNTNLNADYVDGAHAGINANSVLLLDANANAGFQGTDIRMAGGTLNSGNDRVRLSNALGSLWLLQNGSYASPAMTTYGQTDATLPSSGIKLEAGTGKILFNYVGPGAGQLVPTITVDKASNLTTFATSVTVPAPYRLGLGTATPAYSLDVLGIGNFVGNSTSGALNASNALGDAFIATANASNNHAINASSSAGEAILATTATGTALHGINTAGGGLALKAEGTSIFITTPRVGINKTNPTSELDVNGTITTNGLKFTANTPTTVGWVISAADTLGNATWSAPPTGATVGGSGLTNYVTVWGSSTTLRSSTAFYETGSNYYVGPVAQTPNSQMSLHRGLSVNNSNSSAVPDTIATVTSTLWDGAVVFGGNAGGSGSEAIFSNRNATGGATNLGGLSFMTNLNVRMAITSGGLVGVGTTSPTANFEVAGKAIAFGPGVATYARTDYPYLTIGSTGVGNIRTGIQFMQGAGVRTFSLQTDFGLTGAQNFYIQDDVAAANRLLIDSSGNVGLGVTAPLAALHLAGTSIQMGNSGTARRNFHWQIRNTQIGAQWPVQTQNGNPVYTPNANFLMLAHNNINNAPIPIMTFEGDYVGYNYTGSGSRIAFGNSTQMPLNFTFYAEEPYASWGFFGTNFGNGVAFVLNQTNGGAWNNISQVGNEIGLIYRNGGAANVNSTNPATNAAFYIAPWLDTNFNSGNGSGIHFDPVGGIRMPYQVYIQNLTKTTNNFVVPHPVSENKILVHAAWEGPEHAVIYRTEAEIGEDGTVKIDIPNYYKGGFVDLEGAAYQVTPLEDAVPVAYSRKRGVVVGPPGTAVMVQMTATRLDVDLLEVEQMNINPAFYDPTTSDDPADHGNHPAYDGHPNQDRFVEMRTRARSMGLS